MGFLRSSLQVSSLAAALLAVAGCGGGFYIGTGGGDDDPDVSLSADADAVVPGGTLRLVAEADDDFAVRSVGFYRVVSGRRTLLGTDTTRPYELSVRVSDDATGTLAFVARASDFAGQVSQSDTVEVDVVR